MLKRILIVSNSVFPFSTDGQANVVNLLAEGLVSLGIEVHIITLQPEEKKVSEYNRIIMHYLSTKSSIRSDSLFLLYNNKAYINLNIEKEYKDILRKIKPDLVNFHSIDGIGANTVKLTKDLGYKVAVTLHDYSWICPNPFLLKENGEAYKKELIDYDEWGRAIGRWEEYILEKNMQNIPEFINKKFRYLKSALASADIIFAPSMSLLKVYVANGIEEDKIKLLSNPVDTIEILKNKQKNNKKLVFGHIAGYGGRGKGVDIAVEAFKRVTAKKIRLEVWASPNAMSYPSVQYLLYLIKFWKSPVYIFKEYYTWLKEFKNLIFRKIAPGKITYWPKYNPSDKFKVLNRFDCLLVPSMYRESFSLATAEALQFGVPVIASNKGGMTDMIKHDVNGLLFEQGNVDELLNCIELFSSNESLRHELSVNAQKSKFNSSQDYVKKYISLIGK